ncbi:MAG: PH domain-containing protein [Eubacterium sp.]|nr:PH domain-containing protein [Eubacterium sp.]
MGETERLDGCAKKAMYVSTAIVTAIALGIAAGVAVATAIFSESGVPYIVLVVLVVIGMVNLAVSPWFRCIRYRYRIEEDVVYIRKGYINVEENFVPMERVQNITVKQGPIDRTFDVGTITVTTAGGNVDLKNIRRDKIDKIADYLRMRANIEAAAQKAEEAELETQAAEQEADLVSPEVGEVEDAGR